MYWAFAFHVERANILYYCREVSELVVFTFELQKSLSRRGEDEKELRVPREVGMHFVAEIPFRMCSSHIWYLSSIPNNELGLQKIVKYDAGED